MKGSPKKSIIFESIEKYIGIFLMYISFYSLSQYLGVKVFGVYSYLLAVVGLFSSISSFGVRQWLLVRTNQKRVSSVILSNAFTLELFGSICLCLVLIMFAFLVDELRYVWYFMIFSAINLFTSVGIYESYFIGNKKGYEPARWNFCKSFLNLNVILIGIYIGASLSVIILIQILPAIFYCAFAYLRGTSHLKISAKLIDHRITSSIFRLSLPYLITLFSASVYNFTDQLMLKFISDYSSVGSYAIASKIFVGSLVLNHVIGKNTYQYLDSISFLRRFNLLSIIISLAILTFGLFIFPCFYDPSFNDSRICIIIFSFGVIPFSLGSLTARWLEINNALTTQNFRITIAAFLNVVLNILLIPSFGAKGAALATVVSFTCQYVITPLIYRPFVSTFVLQLRSLTTCFKFYR